MEGFTAPSFSLGIDLDFDSDPDAAPIEESVLESAAESSIHVKFQPFEDDRDFDPETLTLDQDLLREEEDTPPVLKRLKQGSVRETVKLPIVIDEIEEFSKEDRCRDEYSTTQNRYACSSSKLSLRNHGILSAQPLSKLNAQENTLAYNAPTSANLKAETHKGMIPKLTVSPLRRIQFIDSDSDEPSDSEDLFNVVKKVDGCTKDSWHTPSQSMSVGEQKAKISSELRQKHLWEDFHPKENRHLATPAFDEFCEEYFGVRQDMNIDQSKRGDISFNSAKSLAPDYFLDGSKGCFQRNSIQANVAHCRNLPNPLPPAYCYFYHQDPRIQTLVHDRLPNFSPIGSVNCFQRNSIQANVAHCRNLPNPLPPAYCYFYHQDPRIQKFVHDRLPNFSPIGSVNHRGNQQSETTDIDYMSQFDHRDTPTRIHGTGGNGLERSSKKSKKNLSNANAKEVSQASGSWVNPRSSTTIPKDASKRQVRADSNATGHWYTGEDGEKENGGRFRRKKAAVKKAAAKKPAVKRPAAKKKAAVKKHAANKKSKR
ncbi:uncharacterized protein LOC143884106 isoform X2 [Tasmannia lanceolata]|uniref:uncharacterized protein LOC143884106 isoform X2 n=1 Tax=Tasmannia lanceolata TaxID=3420 RepID=UPI004063604F